MLVQAIEAFIGSWNQHAAPFEWTKREVHRQGLVECKRSANPIWRLDTFFGQVERWKNK